MKETPVEVNNSSERASKTTYTLMTRTCPNAVKRDEIAKKSSLEIDINAAKVEPTICYPTFPWWPTVRRHSTKIGRLRAQLSTLTLSGRHTELVSRSTTCIFKKVDKLRTQKQLQNDPIHVYHHANHQQNLMVDGTFRVHYTR